MVRVLCVGDVNKLRMSDKINMVTSRVPVLLNNVIADLSSTGNRPSEGFKTVIPYIISSSNVVVRLASIQLHNGSVPSIMLVSDTGQRFYYVLEFDSMMVDTSFGMLLVGFIVGLLELYIRQEEITTLTGERIQELVSSRVSGVYLIEVR